MTAQWFGDYEIVRRLRVGGMATLYLARRHGAAGFARLVALKMIHPHLVEQPNFVEMFVDEARICSRISHPNVVHVEEFGVIDHVHYLVMEHLDGCSVHELLVTHHRERRTLDPELAARIIMQVAGGLHAAHETRDDDGQPLDVIHRDISPSNILVSIDGNAKLIDFGIAKARNRLSETEAGITLKGKYKYVAPEQATRKQVDRRCDLFSLGIVFWELLVGQPLFPEDTHVALFSRLARTDVEAPSALNPAVPQELDAIVLAMLQHDPDDRPQTAAEVQRWIATAVPGAANRDPSELGALAREVRDRRAAREATGDPAGQTSHASFSPTPRSHRVSASEPRFESEATSASRPHGSQPGVPGAPRWAGRRLQLGVAAVLGIVATVSVVVAQHTWRAPASAAAATVPSTTTVLDLPIAAPVTPPPLPTTALPAPSPLPDEPPPGNAAVAAAEPADAARVPTAAAPPVRRDPARPTARPRPARRAPSVVVAAPAPAVPTPPPAIAVQPFSSAPFDDAANERTPVAPNPVSVKKTPIVPDFDN